MFSRETELREELARVCRRVYERGLAVATDGNASARLPGDTILVTPSGACLGELTPDDMVKCDLDGGCLVPAGFASAGGDRRPTSELAMHLACYRARQDVRAVIHAHPAAALAFSVAGLGLNDCVLPEVILAVGTIVTAPYATPTTQEVPRAIENLVRGADALLLDLHGSLTVGPDLKSAFYKLERMEHAAQVILGAHTLGGARSLDPLRVTRLQALRRELGLKGPAPACGS